jgi:4-alpha-glucanotransferase
MTTDKPKSPRGAGILLHPTSLPGPYGIGDLGPAAYAWVDALARGRQKWWQVLPLGPTGFGDSPYQSFSAFAGTPFLISPDALADDGLVPRYDLAGVHLPAQAVDYPAAGNFKTGLTAKAWQNFRGGAASWLRGPFDEFVAQNASWLNDFALFLALKEAHGGRGWNEWPEELVLRRPEALQRARRELADAFGLHQFRQFLFYRQWRALRQYARERGVRLIGDVPIFIAADSADVWANPRQFLLDERRRPRVVAGVPPDYFSKTGQRWGNPLYAWQAMKADGYAWWIARLRAMLGQVDLVRIDHFRGFEACWEIPADMETAEVGRWAKGPGADLFYALQKALDGLPLLAEDLGLITPEVEALRDQFRLPGMRILQFAFGGAAEDRFLPHNYEHNAVVYTGTHDNDTTMGWYRTLAPHERTFLHRYMPHVGDYTVAWDMIRLAWGSVADLALAPLQDILSLGPEARMNLPGRPDGNWRWRFTTDQLNPQVIDRLADVTEVYYR